MNSNPTILIVDDKPSARFLFKSLLGEAGYRILEAASGDEAMEKIQQKNIDLVLTDIVMPGMDGLSLLKESRKRFPDLPVVLVTAHASIDSAIEGQRQGASDYFTKPVNSEMVLLVIQRLLENSRIKKDYSLIINEEMRQYSLETLATGHSGMRTVLDKAKMISSSPTTSVCISGESGVGKEVLARAIHVSSGLPMAKFIPVNCAGVSESLIDSELFGHVRGAFTGAQHRREGKCSMARGGTLFLDEIGDMPLSLQPKLLRLMDTGEYEQLGSDIVKAVDCRIVTATNRNLSDLSDQGLFRWDLFHRLNTFPLHIPPLRERRQDIPMLVSHFVSMLCQGHGNLNDPVSADAMGKLVSYDWPGNIRELRNCIENALIMSGFRRIQSEHIKLTGEQGIIQDKEQDYVTLNFKFHKDQLSLEAITQKSLEWAMMRSGRNKSQAARLLKTSRKLFYNPSLFQNIKQ